MNIDASESPAGSRACLSGHGVRLGAPVASGESLARVPGPDGRLPARVRPPVTSKSWTSESRAESESL
jgi:hypothetical protein